MATDRPPVVMVIFDEFPTDDLLGPDRVRVGDVAIAMRASGLHSNGYSLARHVLLTTGEVLVSATGLEFAYSRAPPKLKGVLMSFWLLSVTVGGLWVLLVNSTVKSPAATNWIETSSGIGVISFQMFFFAGFAFVAAAAFGLVAKRYTLKDYYRKA